MHATPDSPQRAKWEVRWINPATKRREVKDFDTDHQGAVELYARVKAAGRKGATLRCKNIGFPPPDKYADREEVVMVVKGRRCKAKRMITPRVYIARMGELNLKGIWWCPYCQQLRKFVFRKGHQLGRSFTPRPHMACPMCDITQDNWHVKRYNPQAGMMEYREGTVRSPESNTDAAQRRRERRAARKAKREREAK